MVYLLLLRPGVRTAGPGEAAAGAKRTFTEYPHARDCSCFNERPNLCNHECKINLSDGKEKEKKPDLGLLEEDDEFEEFPAEDWTGADEDEEDVNVWEDNWDDDNVEDDFSLQLRAELEKQGKTIEGQEPMKT